MKIWGRGLLAIVVGTFFLNAPGRVSSAQSFDITVMTQNVYLGADTNPILRATSLPDLQAAIVNVANSVFANDFARRAEAIASEIAEGNRPPLLIGLQEAEIVSLGNLSVNYADVLTAALKARGLNYTYSIPGVGAAVHRALIIECGRDDAAAAPLLQRTQPRRRARDAVTPLVR